MNYIRIFTILTFVSTPLFGSFPSKVDPYPLYTTANMLGNVTSFGHCDPEYSVRFSVTPFRQNAYKAYKYNDHNAAVIWSNTSTTIDNNECEIGNIYGNWNYLGLFYTNAARQKFTSLPLKIEWLDANSSLIDSKLQRLLSNPQYADPNQLLGFMSAPMEFRSYGCRLQADVRTPIGVGISGKISIGQQQQVPRFSDKTPTATAVPGLETNTFANDKTALTGLVFNRINDITQTLELDIGPYCKSTIDQGIFSLFFTKNFDCFTDEESPYSPFVCSPFVAIEWEPSLNSLNPNNLTAPNIGTNGHTGYGIHGGVTFNFLDTIELGFDIAPTWFTTRTYAQAPMPTSEKQVALFPTKADYTLEPGTNWTFGASMAAFDFTQLFSGSCEFRYIHHCKDHIELISEKSFKDYLFVSNGSNAEEITSYLRPDVLEDRSAWSSCFINLGVNMRIWDGCQLGCAFQMPVRMRNAYYGSTILGSIAVQY